MGKVVATASTTSLGNFDREGLVDNHNYAIKSVHSIELLKTIHLIKMKNPWG